jgi:CheY-like chemotaxis protein
MKEAALVLLVVEDNPADVLLLSEAIEQIGSDVRVHVVGDGSEATDFLARRGSHAAAPRPDLIVLDLNLPIKSGREVLAEIMADPALNDIPVAVLTTSKTEFDVCDGFTKGRCRYHVKTGDFNELVEIVQQLERFARSVRGDRAGLPGGPAS